MKYCIPILLIFINTSSLYAQLEHNIRFFNNRLAIRFLPEFKAFINIKDNPPFASEGRITISDPVKGDMLFYQGAITPFATKDTVDNFVNPVNSTLRNFNHEKITSQKYGLNYMLHGDITTVQAYTALPSNYECGKYILISLVGSSLLGVNKPMPLRGSLAFNILDMNKNNGKGLVENPLNSIILKDNLTEEMSATIHANSKDYWILTTLSVKDKNIIAIPIIQDKPDTSKMVYSYSYNERPLELSSMSISPNSKYVYLYGGNYKNKTYIYSFDNSTGSVVPLFLLDSLKDKNNISLNSRRLTYRGGMFSRDSRMLYVQIYNPALNNETKHNTMLQIDLVLKKYQILQLPVSDAPQIQVGLASDGYNYYTVTRREFIDIWRIKESHKENPVFEKMHSFNSNDLPPPFNYYFDTGSTFNPNFSHHVFDPNYKRIPTLCDLPKMLPFDTSICVGEWLTLSPKFESLPTMNLWQWEAKNADIKTGNDSLFTTRFLSTGTFPVRFIGCNANGCDTNSIQVTVYEKPTIVPSPDYTLCPGESVRIGRMNTPVFEYSWSPADYLDNPKSANPLCTPEKNMQYILTVKNSNGCENYDTVNVTLGGELSVFAGADTSVCEGEQIQLNASGAENFSWSPADGLSDATIANPLFTGTSTTQYIVTGKSGNCEGKDTILVTVNEKPIIIASENREICSGDTVHLSAKGALEYSWSPAEGLHNPTIANPIFTGTKTTEYIVTGKNGNCFDSKKILITVNEKPTLSVSENRELCAGDTVHLSAKGALEYSWSPAEGLNNATIANPIFIGTKTTEYTVTGKNGNCFDSKKILITVNEKPTLSVSENREICLGDTVHLHANNADNYLWTPSTYLNNATINNPIAQPTENITYTVRGTNTNGCYEEKTISITINNDQEKTISLQLSDTAQYAPGTIVPVKIVIPAGLAQTTVTLNYDPCCVRCDSIFTPNTGISTVFLRNNALRFTSISPNKESREIILPCTIYLPPDGRKSEKFTLSDIIHSEQCLIVRANNDEILYDPSCAWQFRGVQQTGRFGIESDGIIARLYTGYGGAITVKIFDLTGVEVWHYSSLYNSTDMQEISLPSLSSGIYIMQASNGVWHDECVMMK